MLDDGGTVQAKGGAQDHCNAFRCHRLHLCGRPPERFRRPVVVLALQAGEGKLRNDPELERKAWLDELAESDRMRSGYQEQAAKGLMTIDELAARLKELEGTRRAAERELAILRDHREDMVRLEQDKDQLLDLFAAMAPEALRSLTPEERHQIYKMLRLKVIAHRR